MSIEMKKSLTVSEDAIHDIEKRISELSAHGVSEAETASGELNISGCASSSCMAWD